MFLKSLKCVLWIVFSIGLLLINYSWVIVKVWGCRDAIFTLQGVIKSINLQGYTATLCALDMSKAFDRMSHYGMYIYLMELSISMCFIDILIC